MVSDIRKAQEDAGLVYPSDVPNCVTLDCGSLLLDRRNYKPRKPKLRKKQRR